MMQDRLVTFRLSDDLIAALTSAARAAGRAPADMIREALSRTFVEEADEDGGIPAAVMTTFRAAADWVDLQTRLRRLGFVLRLDGTGKLALHGWPKERRIMPVESLGHTLATLSLRFHAPFPGGPPSGRSAGNFQMHSVVARLRAVRDDGSRAA